MIIYVHLWSSMIISDPLWSSMFIYDHLWSSTIIYVHLWSSIIIYVHLSFMIIYVHLWSFMILYDHLWSSTIIYVHLWSSMIIYDHLWSSMWCFDCFSSWISIRSWITIRQRIQKQGRCWRTQWVLPWMLNTDHTDGLWLSRFPLQIWNPCPHLSVDLSQLLIIVGYTSHQNPFFHFEWLIPTLDHGKGWNIANLTIW